MPSTIQVKGQNGLRRRSSSPGNEIGNKLASLTNGFQSPKKAKLINKAEENKGLNDCKKWMVIIGSFIHPIGFDELQEFSNGLMIIDDSRRIVFLEEIENFATFGKESLRLKLNQLLAVRESQQERIGGRVGEIGSEDLTKWIHLIRLRPGELIIPGFVDTHTHAVQYNNIGLGQQYQLLDWLKNVTFPEEMRFQDKIHAQKSFERAVNRLINVGTTTACYFSSIHLEASKILAEVCHKAGQRAFIGKCNMDRNEALKEYKENSAQESVEDTVKLINYIRQELLPEKFEKGPLSDPKDPSKIQPIDSRFGTLIVSSNEDGSTELPAPPMVQAILTPRFAISCSEELLSGLGELLNLDPNLHLQTHLCESKEEIKITKGLFKENSSYTEVYDRFGLLRSKTILAHCNHLEPKEIELIKLRNSGLSHCPTSNFNLTSGVCSVKRLVDAGVEKIGLGSDVSGGYGIGILSSIRDGCNASKSLNFGPSIRNGHEKHPKQNEEVERIEKENSQSLSLENLFYLGSLGGAKVCELDRFIGNFEIGKQFDGLLIQTGAHPTEKNLINDGKKDDWFERFSSEAYRDGSNPNFFVGFDCGEGRGGKELKLIELLEKFLFTGDDRNIGTVFINSNIVGGSRPIELP